MHSIDVKLPFVVYAEDYHQFAEINKWLIYIFDDVKVKVKEIEFDYSINLYRAIVYKGRYPSKKDINTLCEEALVKFNKIINDKRFG